MFAKGTQQKERRPAVGFTLIELLVAISVLAVIAVLGWRSLDSIVRTRAALTAELVRTRGMQLTLDQLQNDCLHWVESNPAAMPNTLVLENGRLTLVRTVFAEQQPTRWQIIAYRLQASGTLTRYESPPTRDLNELLRQWQTIVPETTFPDAVAVQAGVEQFAWRVWLDDGNGWRAPAIAAPGMPAAAFKGLEVVLRLSHQATTSGVTKIFLLGAV